jgi:hypothetical protein
MNAKRLPETIMVACLIGLAAWWFWPVKPGQVKPVVVHVHPARVDETSPPPSELPPEPTPVPVVDSVETPAPPIAVDPQAEVGTAVSDFIHLFQSGDYVALLMNYIPPDQFPTEDARAAEAQSFQQMAQAPQFQQRMQQMVIQMQLIENMTPTYDATGNLATYRPPDGSSPVVFVRVNGRWYRKD